MMKMNNNKLNDLKVNLNFTIIISEILLIENLFSFY